MVFSHHWIDISGEKSYGWGDGGVGACRIIVSASVPVPFLSTLDFGFGTRIWDLDLGLGFGTGLGLDNNQSSFIKIIKQRGIRKEGRGTREGATSLVHS